MRKIILSLSLLASTSFAAPYIVTYRENPEHSSRLNNPLLSAQGVEVLLKSMNIENEAQVLGLLRGHSVKIKSLWIAQASLMDLGGDQVEILRQSDNVQSVQPVRSLQLRAAYHQGPEPREQQGRPDPLKFTWGLRKIEMPAALDKYPGLTGKGVRVGILDTGIDSQHETFRGKQVVYRNFLSPNQTTPMDDHGHGTHVAGTIAGYVVRNQRMGIAPDVELVIGKIFSSTGSSDDAQAVLSLQWMANPDGNPETDDAPQVINGSWNADYPVKEDPSLDPFCKALTNLKRLNILSVFAAGNDAAPNKIRVPGACPDSITVGSTDRSDRLSDFSSQGPVLWSGGGKLDKPDISAPGSEVESADVGGGWTTKSGTSMAAPHVTGALAILLQQQPDSEMAKAMLLRGANDLGAFGYDHKFGVGRLNLLNSIEGVISPTNE